MNPRVESIMRQASARILADEEWYRQTWRSMGGRASWGVGAVHRRLRSVVQFTPDAYVSPGGAEMIQSAERTWSEGGDCEDLNLVLLGGLIYHNITVRGRDCGCLYAVFVPTIVGARHVFLRTHGYDLDLVRPTWMKPADEGLRGEALNLLSCKSPPESFG